MKVAFNLFVQTTLVTLPIAYMTKSLIYRYSVQEAFRRYVDDIKNHGLLKKYFILWGPVQCMTFSIVPEHYRITFIAVVSFFWMIILSSIISKNKHTTTSTVGQDDDTATIGSNTLECNLEDGETCAL